MQGGQESGHILTTAGHQVENLNWPSHESLASLALPQNSSWPKAGKLELECRQKPDISIYVCVTIIGRGPRK